MFQKYSKLHLIKINDVKKTSFEFFLLVDKVFGFDSHTKQVYEDGAKEVALCVLDGINCKNNINVSVMFCFCDNGFGFDTFGFCSKHFCVWTNEQWEDIHNEWHH